MSRGSYGYVGRRSGGAAWQWVIIGVVMGFGCSVVLVLLGLASGILSLDPNSVANVPTQTPFVITATAAPVTPTIAPTEAPATATQPIQLEDVLAPTASPTIDATFLTLQPTTSLATPVGAQTNTSANLSNTGGDTFASLLSYASDLGAVDGGTFTMGTSPGEVSAAVAQCTDGTDYGGNPGNCDVAYGEDSYPEHQVTISAFNMEVTEVTYEQFLRFMNLMGAGSHRNGCDGMPCMQTRSESETSNIQYDGANYSVPVVISEFPVVNVTWYGAQAYCQAIGRRLPTEAEWEHAARGPNDYIYPWGNTWDPTRASTRRPADPAAEPGAVQVLSFPDGQSDYGMLNMAGNVAEWVSDWYDARFYGRPEATIPDPTGPTSGTDKVVRGGSWDAVPFFARSVHRQTSLPNDPQAWIGFRCAQDANAQPLTTNPLGADTTSGDNSDLVLPTSASGIPGANEENIGNSQPTLPPLPTARPTTVATLAPGG